MSAAVAVDLAVTDPGGCPAARTSDVADAEVTSVARATAPDEDGRLAEEFTLQGDGAAGTEVDADSAAVVDADSSAVVDADSSAVADVSRVAAFESHDVYRFTREQGAPCVCELVEGVAGPVSDVTARDGTLYLSMHASDLETVRSVVGELREQFDGVRVRQLTRTGEAGDADPVIVDRDRLTDRQREVLETAHDLGYFEHPKGANGTEVAQALEISPSTFREHLAAAQSKLLDAILEGE